MSFSVEPPAQQSLQVIDSHTGGEPTRVVIANFPDLGTGTLPEKARRLEDKFTSYRKAIIQEPRGTDYLVGALLLPSTDPDCVAGVIFFNNVGLLGMCGHGTIGVAVTLAYQGKIEPGLHQLETTVGKVSFELRDRHQATIHNVPSYRYRKDVAVDVPGEGSLRGDIAWGGNWFFLVNRPGETLRVENQERLISLTWKIRQALQAQQITGAGGAEIDHIELFGPPEDSKHHSRNFVLCPGKAYDRSPCGTGTSAKLACLVADDKLKPGEVWYQESVTGSVFAGQVIIDGEQILPIITGSAYITAETKLILQPEDPLRWGIGSD